MHQSIIDTAARALEEVFDQPVQLRLTDVVYDYEGSPSTILRCATGIQSPHVPKSVIVKLSKRNGESLLYEAVGLTFLAEVIGSLAPELYRMDRNAGILIMEDLGSPPETLLGNILFGPDPDAAESALLAFQRVLAAMHRATMGNEERFHQIRSRFNNPTQASRHRIHTITEALRDLPDLLTQIGITVHSAAQEDIQEAAVLIDAPGPFLALVHGDATPANAFYTHGKIRLFDLETAGFRHCLLDGCYSRLRYLHSVWARQIPQAIQQRLMAAYREALLAGSVVDGAAFDHHFAACCAGWMAGLCMLLPGVIEHDRQWGRSTNRQRVIAGLAHFAHVSDELGAYKALADTCRAADRQLRRQWPDEDCTMRLYPAFIS